MTRRDLLAVAVASRTLHAEKRLDRSCVSAITDEIAASPAEAVAFARHYGLKWVELRGVPGSKVSYYLLPEPDLRAAAREFAANGIGVSFLNTGLLKFSLPGTEPARSRAETPEARAKRIARDQAQFDRRMEDLRKAIDAAHILGVDKVRVFTFSRVAEPMKLLPRIAGILEPMVALAAKEKVHLLVENEGSCNVATCAETAALMSLLPSRYLGINWDALNGTVYKEPPFPDGYNLLPRKRIGNVQIKGRSILEGPQRLDWAAIFKALADDGYRGCFGLETHIFGPELIQKSHESMQEILRILETLWPTKRS